MDIVSIARKDMLILFKDRSTLLQLFLLPLVFIVLYVGIGTAAQSGEEEDLRIPVAVVNLDPTGEISQSFIDNLNGDGGIKAEVYDQSEAQELLEADEISRLLTIPTGFSEDVLSGESVAILFENDTPDDQENQAVSLAVTGVAYDTSLQANLLGSLENMRQMQAANPEATDSLSAEKAMEQARMQFERAETDPLIAVEQRNPSTFEDEEELSFAELAVPSMTVLFVFLTAQTMAQSVYDEKKVGSFRRLLAAPISNASLMSGKMLPNFLTVLLQVAVIFFAAIFIFPALGWDKLTLGNDFLALVLLVVATALCSTALGALISAIAKTEAQIGGVSTVILWVMAFIGGTIVPFFLLNDALGSIGKLTPQFWAVTGFYDLLVRGQSLADITDSLAALLGFGLIFLVIAIWRFDFE
ncbi:MAG TPA: ABC transporter permease [candidate division Zixibacteria bacterium]|nr:ABC transporter permease [candidate division Zixibacteria bacterium]